MSNTSRPRFDIQAAFTSSGRVRLHVPLLGGNLALARLLRARLGQLPQLGSVAVSPVFARVSLRPPGPLELRTLTAYLAAALPELEVDVTRWVSASDQAETHDLTHISAPGRAIFKGFRGMSREVSRATAGRADLRILLPLCVLGAAAERALRAPRLGSPQWLTLAVFGYTLFRDLNVPHAGPATPEQP